MCFLIANLAVAAEEEMVFDTKARAAEGRSMNAGLVKLG